MILKEEYDDAESAQGGWFAAMSTTFILAVMALAGAIADRHAGLAVCACGCAFASLVSGVLLFRCRRTIKAWRDQKRLELAQKAVRDM